MKRVIKNYTNITPMHIELIAKAFPEGFGDDDLQVLSMPNGKYLRALEVKTEDTIYLFRIDDEMIEVLEDATDDNFEVAVDGNTGDGGDDDAEEETERPARSNAEDDDEDDEDDDNASEDGDHDGDDEEY
jgi:DNA-directed RNA polymerase subunit delta